MKFNYIREILESNFELKEIEISFIRVDFDIYYFNKYFKNDDDISYVNNIIFKLGDIFKCIDDIIKIKKNKNELNIIKGILKIQKNNKDLDIHNLLIKLVNYFSDFNDIEKIKKLFNKCNELNQIKKTFHFLILIKNIIQNMIFGGNDENKFMFVLKDKSYENSCFFIDIIGLTLEHTPILDKMTYFSYGLFDYKDNKKCIDNLGVDNIIISLDNSEIDLEENRYHISQIKEKKNIIPPPFTMKDYYGENVELNDFIFLNKYKNLLALNARLTCVTYLKDNPPINNLEFIYFFACKLDYKFLSVVNIKSIKELKIIGCDLLNIEEFFYGGIDIISFNLIDIISESIPNLINLNTLSLCGNNICKMDPIINLNNLKILDMSSNKLTEIHDGIKTLKSLTTLNVSDNKIVNLCDSLFELFNLTSLDVSNNLLVTLPNKLLKLTNLKILNIHENNIKGEFYDIGDLYNLEKLHMHKNKLLTIDYSILKLKKIKTISFSGDVKVKRKNISNLLNEFFDEDYYFMSQGTFSEYTEYSEYKRYPCSSYFLYLYYFDEFENHKIYCGTKIISRDYDKNSYYHNYDNIGYHSYIEYFYFSYELNNLNYVKEFKKRLKYLRKKN